MRSTAIRSTEDSPYNNEQAIQWHYTVLDDRSFEIRGKTLFFVVVVFSVLLVLVLLFLYARWACRYRHATMEVPAPATATAPPPPPRGLSAEAINALQVISLAAAGAAGGECSICLGAFADDEGERVKVLPRCRHCFHPECVDRWLGAHPSCPLCRDSLRVDPAVPKIVVE